MIRPPGGIFLLPSLLHGTFHEPIIELNLGNTEGSHKGPYLQGAHGGGRTNYEEP